VTADDLRQSFEKFGDIAEIIMKGRYAFVDYKDVQSAKAAVQAMHGQDYKGEKLTVEHTKKRDPGARGGRGPQENDECWKCGGFGHWSNECQRRGGDRRERGRDTYRRRYDSRERHRYSPEYSRGRSRSGSRDEDARQDIREGRCFFCR
jgi:RNA recognition motif-containing protein